LPVHFVTKEEIERFCNADTSNKTLVIWIGHSTLLLNFQNQIIILDPMFGERLDLGERRLRKLFRRIFPKLSSRIRASPVQFVGSKRYRPVPIAIKDIPRLDSVVISHNHYDHMDMRTVTEIKEHFGDKVNWFVGTGLADWFKSNDIATKNISELNWWESKTMNNLEFTFVPAQHWSTRGLFDRNKVKISSNKTFNQELSYPDTF
jgi:N-acyl-phosphatidylethanolamine-hydrolysing phospholipase D